MAGLEGVDDEPGVGRLGSLGGSGRRTNSTQSLETEDTLGLTTEDVETLSKDSSKLPLSCSRELSVSRPSRSTGYVATKSVSEPGVMRSVPPSEDSDTEWKEDIEDAGTCPEPLPLDGMLIPSLDKGGYAWSTVNESDFLRCGRGGTGRGADGVDGLRASEEVEELDKETDLRELYDAFRGGNGGADLRLLGGEDSKLIRGGEFVVVLRMIESETCLTAPFTGGLVPVGFWRGA